MAAAVSQRGTTFQGRLRSPVCVFLIAYGVTKLAELLNWSRLHHDVVAMLGLGPGAVTGLLVAGKGAELALTVLAVLALVRRRDTLLFAALAGWTADLALLTVVAAVGGDLGRLLEHGLSFLAFAGLLAVSYRFGGLRPRAAADPPPAATAPQASTPQQSVSPYGPALTRQDLPVRRPDVTRQDLPARTPDITRQDLPARQPDVTRQDLPVRRRPPEPPGNS